MTQGFKDMLRAYKSRSDDELLRIIRSETATPMEKDCATRVLLKNSHRGIFMAAWGVLGDRHLADENVTWIFWNAVLKYDFDKPNRNFNAYVARVSRNEALAYLRSQQHLVHQADMEIYSAPNTPERDHFMLERIERLLASFPGNYREDFTYRHLLGMTWSEVHPEEAHRSTGRVRNSRNRKRMARILKAQGITPGKRRYLHDNSLPASRIADAEPADKGSGEP